MVKIEPLDVNDIPAAMELVEAAGWNQTPADWRRVIVYQPHGCFKAVQADRLIGTVTSTSYGEELAWIGMMLVAPDLRRQGIGRLLMQRVIEALQATRVKTIKLDATPAGRPLYEQLGFVAQFDFQRWQRPAIVGSPTPIESSSMKRLSYHQRLDHQAFGVDRMGWLLQMAAASCCIIEPDGYGMRRPGRIADYLGPVIASSNTQAWSIVSQLVSSTSSPIFWDLPRQDAVSSSVASSFGCEPVRTLTRMSLGPDATCPDFALQYAICDPATG